MLLVTRLTSALGQGQGVGVRGSGSGVQGQGQGVGGSGSGGRGQGVRVVGTYQAEGFRGMIGVQSTEMGMGVDSRAVAVWVLHHLGQWLVRVVTSD